LTALVVASFSLRRFIGAKNWRRLHWTVYLSFAAATAHGVMSGTDTARPWVFGLYLFAVGAVVAATAWRVLVPPARPTRRVPANHPEGANSNERVSRRDRPVAV
jgi:DMSO/TMAO reductase YedYZ heme-binding membrane subunit